MLQTHYVITKDAAKSRSLNSEGKCYMLRARRDELDAGWLRGSEQAVLMEYRLHIVDSQAEAELERARIRLTGRRAAIIGPLHQETTP